jgi:hypothetical protein
MKALVQKNGLTQQKIFHCDIRSHRGGGNESLPFIHIIQWTVLIPMEKWWPHTECFITGTLFMIPVAYARQVGVFRKIAIGNNRSRLEFSNTCQNIGKLLYTNIEHPSITPTSCSFGNILHDTR